MDEGRKRVIGIMAAILAARKLAQWDGGKRVSAAWLNERNGDFSPTTCRSHGKIAPNEGVLE